MLKPKPSINLNIFTIIDLGHAVYKEKKKQQLSFSQQETSGLAHSWSVRIKAKLAMPWGKNFPKVSMRRELPKGFCVFNSENTDSKTDRCEYRWHRHFGLEKQLFSSLEMGTHWSQGKQEPQGPVSFCRGPSGLGLQGVCWLEYPGWHQQLPEKWSCGVWTVCWKQEQIKRTVWDMPAERSCQPPTEIHRVSGTRSVPNTRLNFAMDCSLLISLTSTKVICQQNKETFNHVVLCSW